MADDWIPVRENLHEQPEVLTIARRMKVRPEVVTGYCVRFWGWVSRSTCDGCVADVTLDDVESVLNMPHFCHMLCEVGWLEFIETTQGCQIIIPNWDVWLSESAKKRAQARKRQQKSRHANVTKVSRTERDKSVTTVQDSTGQKNTSKKSKPKESFRKPSVEEVRAYCQERQNAVDPERFVDYYDAQGWKLSNGNPMKNWQSAVRNWERNAHGAAAGSEDAIAQANAGIEQRRRERAKRQAQYAAEDAQAIRPKLRKA